MQEHQMSTEELLALPVAVDIVEAGRAFGLGRSKSYELAKDNIFPCAVLKLGSRYRVTKTALLEALGVKVAEATPTEPAESLKAAS
jgi:hypothetical protein